MLEMLDQIYPKAFGISDDELESKDLYEQLEYARRQKMILNIVRQQKQMNIARMGKEEKRVDKLIEKITKKIASAEEQERLRQEALAKKAEEEARKAEEARIAEEARKKALQDEAIEKQKAIDKKINDAKEKQEISKQSGTHTSVRARELARGRRERLKNLKNGITDEEEVYVEDNEPIETEAENTNAEALNTQNEPVLDDSTQNEENVSENTQEESKEPKTEELEENSNDEPVEYVDEEGNPVDENGNPIEPVEYVDENGNPVDENGNPIESQNDNKEEIKEEKEPDAADEYEKMLKDSGMSDEEIAALLGEK